MQTAEEKKAYKKRWHLANRERLALRKREQRANNLEETRAHDRDSYYKHRETKLARGRAYHAKNREQLNRDRQKRYLTADREKELEKRRAYYARNREYFADWGREYRALNAEAVAERAIKWREANPEKCSAQRAERRAAKLQATPYWLTQNQLDVIAHLYWKARVRQLSTGQPHEVDHIVPLKSKRVCGLHVDWNLQVLTAKANASKGNRLLPQDQLVDYSASGYVGTVLEPEKLIPRRAA